MKPSPIHFIALVLTFSVGILIVWTVTILETSFPNSTLAETQHYAAPAKEPSAADATKSVEIPNETPEETRIEEFTDDKLIGRRKKNKIEIRCFSRGSERFAELKFFRRSEYGSWIEIQSFKFDKDGVTDCDPAIADFNNDGLKDFTYQSNVAARGANEVRKLFIYDRKHDELVYIKNSEDYPNMVYNERRHCIDAWLFYGATSTVFLKIEGDKLRQFAMVSTGLERVIEVFDTNGNSHILSRRKMNDQDVYTRYLDFQPVIPYR